MLYYHSDKMTQLLPLGYLNLWLNMTRVTNNAVERGRKISEKRNKA